MNRHLPLRRSRSNRGFTLVELLVVISIIMILMGLGFVGVNEALKQAKRAQSVSVINKIQLGMNNYRNDYGYHAVPEDAEAGQDVRYGAEDGSAPEGWEDLTLALNGNRGPNTGEKAEGYVPNPREIQFTQFLPEECEDDILIQPMRSPKTSRVQYFTTWVDWNGDGGIEDLPNTKTLDEKYNFVAAEIATYATNDGIESSKINQKRFRSSY